MPGFPSPPPLSRLPGKIADISWWTGVGFVASGSDRSRPSSQPETIPQPNGLAEGQVRSPVAFDWG